MNPGQIDHKQATGTPSRFTKGLGSLANGVIAAILVGLTLLVAVVLAMEEQDLVASQIPTATAIVPLATPTAYATSSPLPTWEPPTVQPTLSTLPSPSPFPSVTPSPQPEHTAVASCFPPAHWRPYTVQSGQSLAWLAWRFSISEYNLLKANCLTSRRLYPGQLLYVPNVSARQACGTPPGWVTYTVRYGDTLYGLAWRYGTTVTSLRVANCLMSNTIYTGQQLWVPPSIPKPTSHPAHTRIPTEPVPTHTSTATVGPSPTASPTSEGSATPGPAASDTVTPGPATDTPVPDTPTAPPEPSSTSVPPTATAEPTEAPTATPVPPTSTPVPLPPTSIPPTDTPIPTEAP